MAGEGTAHHSGASSRLETFIQPVAGAVVLCLPSLLLGTPSVFYDTLQYHNLGAELFGAVGLAPAHEAMNPSSAQSEPIPAPPASDGPTVAAEPRGGLTYILARSFAYSLLFYGLFEAGGLWTVAGLQALVLAAVIWRFMQLCAPGAPRFAYLILMGALSLLTTAPFIATFAMPDVFAPLAILAACALLVYGDRMGLWETLAWVALLAFACMTHATHTLLTLGLIGVAAIAFWRLGFGVRAPLLRAAPAFAALATALAVNAAYAQSLERVFDAKPLAPPFLAMRVIADGPGRDYLRETCPGSGWTLCKHVQKPLAHADHLLWSGDPALGVYMVSSVAERYALAAEQRGFLVASIAHDPLAQLAASSANAARQTVFYTVGTHQRLMALWLGEPDFADSAVGRALPLRAACAANAPNCRADGVWAIMDPLHTLTPLAAALALGWLAWSARASWSPMRAATGGEVDRLRLVSVMIVLAVLANGAMCGAASGVFERYQSRVIWLVPLLVGMWLVMRWRDGRALIGGGQIAANAGARG